MRSICEIKDCGKPAVAKGLCNMHRQRYARHGDVHATRPEGWGKGHGHPLYERWRSMRRTSRQQGGHVPEWDSFQVFLRDIGEAPGPKHRLYRLDIKKPFGPGNVTWRERVQLPPAGKTHEERAAYQKSWRRERPHLHKAALLKRMYGVTIEWYDAMLEAQGGVCAICGDPETRVHKQAGTVMMLAVDHDAKTGAPRGLLCGNCNTGIGGLKHSVSNLRAAIAYLDAHADAA